MNGGTHRQETLLCDHALLTFVLLRDRQTSVWIKTEEKADIASVLYGVPR